MRDDLPVAERREEIVTSVRENRVTIITAQTASGKSTQVAQYLLAAGYKVIMTEPRVKTVLGLASRIAEEMGTSVGRLVGYHISGDRKVSKDTQLLICTDGIEVIEQVMERRTNGWVLIIDELHTWNKNVESLIGWILLKLQSGADIRVVLMSATLEVEELAARFDGMAHIIQAAGRTYPVRSFVAPRGLLYAAAKYFSRLGKNILIFRSSREQVERCVSILRDQSVPALVLPLYRELPDTEQQEALQPHTSPVIIVATDYANFLEFPDLDIVLDTGTEKRMTVVDGVERLATRECSQIDLKQRAGRVGRKKPGTYILFSTTRPGDRRSFPLAEVETTLIDDVVMRFKSVNINPRSVPFFHRPPEQLFGLADQLLIAIGAMSHDGRLTRTGLRMARIPLPTRLSRIIVEAQDMGLLNSVVPIAALIENGGIRAALSEWRNFTDERTSDVIAELDVWKAYRANPTQALWYRGRVLQRIRQIEATEHRIWRSLRKSPQRHNTDNTDDLIACCLTGFAGAIHTRSTNDEYSGPFGSPRQLDRISVLNGQHAQTIAALPFDREYTMEYGTLAIKRLLVFATRIQ